MIDERKIDIIAKNFSSDSWGKYERTLEKMIRSAYIEGFKEGVQKAIETCSRCDGKGERLSMKIGDKVQVVDKPISLLKQHAGIKGEIIKKGIDNKWLVDLGGYHQWWWVKGYDIEVITDDEEEYLIW